LVAQLERPQAPPIKAGSPGIRSDAERIARRRAAFERIDPILRPRLRSLLPAWLSFAPTLADHSVYASIPANTPATGGQWTIAARVIGWVAHSVWSYTLLLDFDADDQPACLRICGQAETVAEDLTESGIETAFARAAASGPLRTGAAHAFAGISL
jgi:hypothetical protein